MGIFDGSTRRTVINQPPYQPPFPCSLHVHLRNDFECLISNGRVAVSSGWVATANKMQNMAASA